MRHVPNLLTSLRILLAFVFPWVSGAGRLIVVTLALLTEYFDGAISRWFNAQTELGKFLDPIADKLLFMSVMGTSLVERRLGVGEFVMLGVRDWVVAVGTLVLVLQKRWAPLHAMKPRILGKTATAFQYLAFFDLLLSPRLNGAILWVTFGLGVLAAGDYLRAYFQALRALPERRVPKAA